MIICFYSRGARGNASQARFFFSANARPEQFFAPGGSKDAALGLMCCKDSLGNSTRGLSPTLG